MLGRDPAGEGTKKISAPAGAASVVADVKRERK